MFANICGQIISSNVEAEAGGGGGALALTYNFHRKTPPIFVGPKLPSLTKVPHSWDGLLRDYSYWVVSLRRKQIGWGGGGDGVCLVRGGMGSQFISMGNKC